MRFVEFCSYGLQAQMGQCEFIVFVDNGLHSGYNSKMHKVRLF